MYPVVGSRSDIKWSPYHQFGINKVMISGYYLPKRPKPINGKIPSNIHEYLIIPDELIVFMDNGMFTRTLKNIKTPSTDEWISQIEKWKPTLAPHIDLPINLSKFSKTEKRSRAEKTLMFAEEFITQYKGAAIPVGVIQSIGLDNSVEHVEKLSDMSYKHVALGTMGKAVSEELLKQASAIKKAFPNLELHIFGATPPKVLPLLVKYNVNSGDSRTALNMSQFGTILDYKTYKRKNVREIIKDEWNCKCAVCKSEFRDRVLLDTTKRLADVRAVHNQLMLIEIVKKSKRNGKFRVD